MEKSELARLIGRKISEAREAAGLSRADVGKQLGLTERGYGHIEAGRSLITLDHFLKLPLILGKPLTYFLPGYIPDESERDNPRLDPRFQYIETMWRYQPEYAKDIFYDRFKFMEIANPHVRANMRAAGIEPPPLPEDLSEKQRRFLEGE